MLRYTFLFLVCLSITWSSFSQQRSKRSEADYISAVGDSLLEVSQFRSAIDPITIAKDLFQQENELAKVAKCYNLLFECYYALGMYDSAYHCAHQVKVLYTLNDEEKIQALINLSKVENLRNNLNRSKAILDSALKLTLKLAKEESYASVMRMRGVTYLMLGDNEQGLEDLIKSKQIFESIGDDKEIATTYRLIGRAYRITNKFQPAEQHVYDALNKIRNLYGDYHPETAAAYQELGRISSKQGRFKEALNFHTKSYAIRDSVLGKGNIETAYSLNSAGLMNEWLGNTEVALNHYFKAIPIAKSALGDNHSYVGALLNNVGLAYHNLGLAHLSMEYHFKSLKIKLNALDESHPDVAYSYINIGALYSLLGKHELALDYKYKALKIRRDAYGELHLSLTHCYYEIGLDYAKTGQYEKAIEFISKAENLLLKLVGPGHMQLMIVYSNYIKLYLEMGDLELATKYNELVLDFFSAYPYHPARTLSYRRRGKIHEQMNQQDSALHDYQASIQTNLLVEDVISKIESGQEISFGTHAYVEGSTLITSITRIAFIYLNRWISDSQIEDLKKSMIYFQLGDQLVNHIRTYSTNHSDKLGVGELSAELYEGGIRAFLEAFDQNNEPEHLEKVFRFFQNSKAGILVERLVNRVSKYTGIPDELKKVESELHKKRSLVLSETTIAYYSPSPDTSKVLSLKDELFEINRQIDSINLVIDQLVKVKGNANPERLKSIASIKNELSSKSLLLDYFDGDSLIYIFCVSKDFSKVFVQEKDDEFGERIEYYFDVLRSNYGDSTSAESVFEGFAKSSNYLYRKLLKEPIEVYSQEKQIEELIIVPHGRLSMLPFETLVESGGPITKVNYSNLDYVLKKYLVTYSYSSSVLNYVSPQDVSIDLLAFGPSYNSLPSDSGVAEATALFRDEVLPLVWNQFEVSKIAEIVDGKSYIGEEASEMQFKASANENGILHMAMHTLLDGSNPMNSKFVFTPGADTLEDGLLHMFELYNMQLSADLAVLSACNTSVGKEANGEGIMSLARAFQYAGVPNMVTSLWQVSDQPTSDLMINFYKELDKGFSYAEALRNSKLQYLNNSTVITSNPFYWGAFIYVGESRYDESISFNWILILSGGLSGIFVLILVFRKRLFSF